MDNSYKDNTPNAGKLIDSLRNTGYNNVSAIADLIDNSIDAGAQNVWFSVEPTKGDFRLTVADDGSGMNWNILDQAMRLGSDTERNAGSDLGKFGMGLVTASISIGKKLTVITRWDGEYLTSVQDLDKVIETGKFVKELREATDDEKNIFIKATDRAPHGTVLLIEKCDRIQNGNINEFCKHLSDQLGQIFRMFLSSRKIYVRGTEIKPVDPLFLNKDGTQIFSDESFDVQIGDYKEDVRVRIAALPEYDQTTNARIGINQKNQGFYLMRNNREIAAGEDLGIFVKHNSLNRLRIEVFFTANLDNAMGVNFMKRDIKPNKSIVDKIRAIVYPQISSFKKRVEKQKAAEDAGDIDHNSAAQNITAKSNILINPKEKFTPRMRTGEHPGSHSATGEGSERHGEGGEKNSFTERCRFELRSDGPNNNLFDMDQVGKKVIIYYNIDHPFYQNFIAANKENPDIINTIDYLIYSLASAQLINMDKDNADMFNALNSIFSSNLRTLIN